MKDPHQNIFYYYRGPSSKEVIGNYDTQIEDNTTKALINIIEFCQQDGLNESMPLFFDKLDLKRSLPISFDLQIGRDSSRPDGCIDFNDFSIVIESKVKAQLTRGQLLNHLKTLGNKDWLFVVTNYQKDKDLVRKLSDSRAIHLLWSDVHSYFLKLSVKWQDNKDKKVLKNLIDHFIDYLEVVVMTEEFNGFRSRDFDYWADGDKSRIYAPVLKRKIGVFATMVRDGLPSRLKSIYKEIKVTRKLDTRRPDSRHAWAAIKRTEQLAGKLHQCNFTIEVSKIGLDVNAVIRNGRTRDRGTPLWFFSQGLITRPKIFLQLIEKLDDKNFWMCFCRRTPKWGTRLKRGNESWETYFSIRLSEIVELADVNRLVEILKKADDPPDAPGVHIKYIIDRGNKNLENPKLLKNQVVGIIKKLEPFLDFISQE